MAYFYCFQCNFPFKNIKFSLQTVVSKTKLADWLSGNYFHLFVCKKSLFIYCSRDVACYYLDHLCLDTRLIRGNLKNSDKIIYRKYEVQVPTDIKCYIQLHKIVCYAYVHPVPFFVLTLNLVKKFALRHWNNTAGM